MAVYAIQRGQTGPIKVGYATNIDSRKASLQSATPERLRLVGMKLGGDRALENSLHKRLARWWVGGEWFEFSPEVAAILSSALDVFDFNLEGECQPDDFYLGQRATIALFGVPGVRRKAGMRTYQHLAKAQA